MAGNVYDLKPSKVQIMRRMSMETYMVRVYTGPLSSDKEYVSIEAEKGTTAEELVADVCRKLRLGGPSVYQQFQLAEVLSSGGQLCKERRMDCMENPVALQLLWPKIDVLDVESGYGGSSSRNSTMLSSTVSSTKSSSSTSSTNSISAPESYRFYLRRKDTELPTGGWLIREQSVVDSFLLAFLTQPTDGKEFPDLCSLPDLNERTLLQNLKARFEQKNIYTYVGSILIAVNPFKFFPIYNPKYVSMYQNKHLGDLPPHIFAVADAAYHAMLKNKKNQCIVISGESGSGKTESTNLLLHHLTALSQKGLHGSGVEQTILGAGPVLEAFGNAKTVHNNNSSRFGKFIQVNYKQNGMVHGAIVEQYLLEKSRIVFQAKWERNYHVFYYLLAGANDQEREALHLSKADQYYYLSQSGCYSVDGVDEKHEFTRLKQSMEMVGFSPETQLKIFSVLSAVLLLGNIEFKKKGDQHHDESVCIKNEETVRTICSLLKVKDKHGMESLTQKRTTAGDETFVITYKMEDAIATRDAMAKCIYGALFDWIVLKVNQALLAKKHDSDHEGNSIGVLDIFGFEDFGRNSFEQFCINYANEHLQYYFNQHIFKFEQEEYRREGIQWKNIEFIDNTGSLELFSKRPSGLFYLLDEECSFPAATNETLLNKFTHHHKNNNHYDVPQLREGAFSISHYAGKVKYFIKDFREKNVDMVRPEIVATLKKSSLTFVRELMGIDPVAVLRWSVVRAFFRCFFAFIGAGKRYRANGGKEPRKRMHRKASEASMQEDKLLNLMTLVQKGSRHSPPTSNTDLPESSRPHSQLSARAGSLPQEHQHRMELHQELLIYSSFESELPENDAKIIRRARKLLMKNKSFKPKQRPCLSFRDIKALKAITSRSAVGSGRGIGSKKQPPTVGAQFQWSLSRLMTTLNQANPFFIRCIKSNKEKAACKFDEELVMRQLRYTGMLATVKIRQSGYNYRLQFQEFIQLYKILLPRKRNHTKADIVHFLALMGLNADNYQIGINKVFLRESEKMHLDSTLHTAIMERVVTIQRWVKTILDRQGYLRLREAAVVLQKYFRRYVAMRDYQNFQLIQLQNSAASLIQNHIRCYLCRRGFLARRDAAIYIQSYVRTVLTRRKFVNLRDDYYATLAKREAERKETERLEMKRIEQEEKEERERQERERREQLEREQHALRVQRELEKSEQAELRDTNQMALREKKEELQSTASDEGVLMKAGSNEELEERDEEEDARRPLSRRDSEESSGILEDSESEMPIPGTPDNYDAVAVTEPDRCAEPLPSSDTPSPLFRMKNQEQYEEDQRQRRASKVQEIAEIFQRTPEKDDIRMREPVKRMRSADDGVVSFLVKRLNMNKTMIESDGRIIVVGRGSKRWKHKKSAAPLAKQESFGDEMELSQDRQIPRPDPKRRPQPIVIPRTGTPLSDESRRQIESAVSRQSDIVNKKRDEPNNKFDNQQGQQTPDQDKGHLSPFHRAKWHITHWVGGTKGKKDDSEDESEGTSSTGMLSPQRHPGDTKGIIGGVSVLPTIPVPSLPSMPHHQPNEMITDRAHIKGSPFFALETHKILPWRERSRKAPKKPKRTTKTRGQSPQSKIHVKLTEWQYSDDLVIDDIRELGYLDEFIAQKENQHYKEPSGTQHTFDTIFRRSLEKFRLDLKSIIALEAPKETHNIKYRELFEKFRQIMEAEMKQEPAAPLMLAVNAFRGFLDEFRKRQESRKKDNNKRAEEKARMEKKNPKRDKNKNKHQEGILTHKGHSFEQVQFRIRTCCEVCSAFIGMTEKGYVCQVCKLACHKKCYIKLNASCKAVSAKNQLNNQMFGAPLKSLVSESQRIPVICDRLMSAIEAIGLYTEGIYRKSGAAPKIKELKALFEEDVSTVHLDDYHVHVLTSLFKQYLRSLPEPLLTFELYEDFLRCLDIEDEKEMIKSLFEVIKKMPKPNFDLFERLVFHLSSVIMHSDANKMSASALSVIFAPVLLRTSDNIQAQEAMLRLPKQMKCIECVLNDSVATLNSKLKDIGTLESAERTTGERLHAVRASRRTTKRSPQTSPVKQASLTRQGAVEEEDGSISDIVEMDGEGEERELAAQEQALSRHLASIHKEKDKLTYKLPLLETRQASSDEDVLSGDELETGSDIYSISDDVDFSNVPSLPPLLHHVTKGRSSGPTQRRPPARYQQQQHNHQYDKENQQQQLQHQQQRHQHNNHPSDNNNKRKGRKAAGLSNVIEDDSEPSFPDSNSSITIRHSPRSNPNPNLNPCINSPFVQQSSFVSVPDILQIGDEDEIMV